MTTFRARAPLRLGFAGGGTDLSPYCDIHGGAVLNVTINRYARATIKLAREDTRVFRSADLGEEVTLPLDSGEVSGAHRLHKAVYDRVVKDYLKTPVGIEITTMIDAPPGSGLGSSSALVVALVEAFRVAFDLPLGQYDLAHLAFEIERRDLALAGGKQDHYAAAFGGVNFIEFLANDRVVVNPLRISTSTLSDLEASTLICFSGKSRASETIIQDQIGHVTDKHVDAISSMHQLRNDAFDMKSALLEGDITAMARVLDRSWQAKKATSSSVSNTLIDSLWAVAHNHGAMAGKVSGAGGGGFMMFLVDPDDRCRLASALREAGGSPDSVSLGSTGAQAWRTSAR